MAEPSEEMQAKARELLRLIAEGGYIDYDCRRKTVATWLTNLLAEARASAGGKWIAVEDTPPDDGVAVLGFRPGVDPFVCEFEDDDGGGCWTGDAGRYYLDGDDFPTHWTPLPPAPKASGR